MNQELIVTFTKCHGLVYNGLKAFDISDAVMLHLLYRGA